MSRSIPNAYSPTSSSRLLFAALWLFFFRSSLFYPAGGGGGVVEACTDILVTPGASHDGAMIAYNADSPELFGVLYHYPAATHPPGTMRQVYDWDSGVYLGEIPEAHETYNVVGNTNEHGLVIGETTFGGVDILDGTQTHGKMDYGSLIYITLQRTKTCREAIVLMDELMNTYGYYSGGESFSLADYTGEVWIMEVIGKGADFTGAVWVAQKIPDGSVAAHANQARITTFDRNDPENFLYAPDVVDIAMHYGLWNATNNDPLSFSFSDVYAPLNFLSVRQGEARVWSIFSQLLGPDFAAEFLNYARGTDLSQRMPLYITPPNKLTVQDVSHLLTSHYEETPLDASIDVGAGIFNSPYRPRPLAWQFNGTMYHNERSVATPKTGWSFVAQVRPWMPRPLACVTWHSCDDSSTAPRVPVYSVSTAISPAYAGKGAQDGIVEPILHFDLTKAFWVQNMVSNLCYSRWRDIYPVVRRKIDQIQEDFTGKLTIADQRAKELLETRGVEAAVQGINRPTPIQMQGLPVALAGRDMVGIAFTGSGKTLTFSLPLVMASLQEELAMPLVPGEGPIGIILAPSRELARQTYDLVNNLSGALANDDRYPKLRTQLLIGGESVRDQLEPFQRRGVHNVVATPGRLRDLLKRQSISLANCRYICLDEADRMLDLGFDQEVGTIMNFLMSNGLWKAEQRSTKQQSWQHESFLVVKVPTVYHTE